MKTLHLSPVAMLAAAACGGSPAVSLSFSRVDANPLNPLSALVTVVAPGGECARVTYAAASDTGGATPCRPLQDGAGTVAVLGVLPSTSYNATLEIWSK